MKKVKLDRYFYMDIRQRAIQIYLDRYGQDEYHHVRSIIESFLTYTKAKNYTVVDGEVYELDKDEQKKK